MFHNDIQEAEDLFRLVDGNEIPTDILLCGAGWVANSPGFLSLRPDRTTSACPFLLIKPPTTIRYGNSLKLRQIMKIPPRSPVLPIPPTSSAATTLQLHSPFTGRFILGDCLLQPNKPHCCPCKNFKRRSLSWNRRTRFCYIREFQTHDF